MFRSLTVYLVLTFLAVLGGSGVEPGGQQHAKLDETAPLPVRPGLPSLIVLPDTQYYASAFPEVLRAQTSWIVRSQTARNIAAVLQVGDLVDTWSDESQWRMVSRSLRTLDGILPYLVVPGNHDTNNDRETLIDSYFQPSSMPWISGTMVPGRIENGYALVDIGGKTWLVICLEFGPRDSAVSWAERVLKAHAHLPAILLTHSYLYKDGTRYGAIRPGADDRSHTQLFAPQAFAYTPQEGINDGEQLWRKLILPNRNVHLVFCGHDNGAAWLTSVRPDGSTVQQILSDYQWLYQGTDRYEGGSGFLRIVEFDYHRSQIHVSTYSPHLDRYLTDNANQFSLNIDF